MMSPLVVKHDHRFREPPRRPRSRALAVVNLGAVRRNVASLRAVVANDVDICAVVKADGYGHGAAAAAFAALDGGAAKLAVATADEAAAVRAAGIRAPLLVLGALTKSELRTALDARAEVVVWREGFANQLRGRGARAHVKLDTGMGRLGTRDALEATRVADLLGSSAGVELVGAMTHFATADEIGSPFLREQSRRFAAWTGVLKRRYPHVVCHAANSAATLCSRETHFDMVRTGIAIYGLDPFNQDARGHGLEPALSLESYVAELKQCDAGESVGYGRSFMASTPTLIATVPIGYADGYRRALSDNAEVLIRGKRYPVVGTISMDNLTVDLGDAAHVRRGDRVLLIGSALPAEELAARLQTINYEITCGIGARVPRAYHVDGSIVVPCEPSSG